MNQELFNDLLPVLDNLERALAHATKAESGLAKGVKMTLQLFTTALAKYGIERFNSNNRIFDPTQDEAVEYFKSLYPKGMVMKTVLSGYRCKGYLLRPAKVVVSSGGDPGDDYI